VRELASHPAIFDILESFYGRKAIPFQTLGFKWGSQQRAHSDALHFSCIPARFMCGVWTALEDVDDKNGPLFYYPGSHRLPEATAYDLGYAAPSPQDMYGQIYVNYENYQEALMSAMGLEPRAFHAKKGDIVIWTSNVVHGGSPVLEVGRTRWSQVTHYYFEECIYYIPLVSEIPTGQLVLKNLTDISTMCPVPHRYNGTPVRTYPLRNGRARIALATTDSRERSTARSALGRLRRSASHLLQSLPSARRDQD
jgi:hypothetical protein